MSHSRFEEDPGAERALLKARRSRG